MKRILFFIFRYHLQKYVKKHKKEKKNSKVGGMYLQNDFLGHFWAPQSTPNEVFQDYFSKYWTCNCESLTIFEAFCQADPMVIGVNWG